MNPTFETLRLLLRPAAVADLDALYGLWNDPDVRRFLFDDEPVLRERAEAVLNDVLALDGGLGLWCVAGRDTGTFLGCVGLMPSTTTARYDTSLVGAIEPLACFSPAAWGKGYATEALQVLIDYAFETLGLDQLAAVHDVPNEASGRLVQRLGFQPVGECDGPKYRMRTYRLLATRATD
jgi:RimJ/RimL family protein N-acetyltransferase